MTLNYVELGVESTVRCCCIAGRLGISNPCINVEAVFYHAVLKNRFRSQYVSRRLETGISCQVETGLGDLCVGFFVDESIKGDEACFAFFENRHEIR